ncbi:aldo/keto reductase [Streptomyces sp. NPDC056296]|uniref:aldo/keto reductase n=1 Tax=Streptomyces sp. NPDC056296 TaxID=3345775 RepID=UPI0035DF97B6
MEMRHLGTNGPHVPAVGLGCSAMSGTYGPADEAEAVATVRAAIDAGLTLLDTADFYGMGHNEWLIRQALRAGDREKITLSVKFGQLRGPDGSFGGSDGRPAAVKNFLTYSLQRLGTDHLDIYRPARLDPDVPIEETVGAIAELVEAGYVGHIGLSEVGAETIRRAHAVHPIADVQLEYSLFSRSIEDGILDTCRELGIGITAYGVLSHGLLSGSYRPSTDGTDPRSHLPRFNGENVEANLALVDNLRKVADARGVTVAQLAIAWVIAQGRERNDIVALIGARRPQRVTEALPAAELDLTGEDLAAIEEAVPASAVAGDRYAAPQMQQLDSER